MPNILECATCNVCLEIHEKIVFYQFPDGLEFSICLPCLLSAQQMLAPDASQESAKMIDSINETVGHLVDIGAIQRR